MSRDRVLWEMASTAGKRDWWEKVFLFALNIGKAEYVMQLLKLYVLARQIPSIAIDELDHHLARLSLLSHAALENGLEKQVSRTAASNTDLQEGYHHLQEHIRLLWADQRLSIPQRASLGRIWGRCGDTRKGMTFQRDGYVIRYHSDRLRSFPLPDFDWQKIAAGSFLMGTEGEEGYADEKPAQRIEIKQPFWISRAAVTNAQYQAFMDAGGYDDTRIWQALPVAAQAWRAGDTVGMALLESIPEKHREIYRQDLHRDRLRHQPRFWQDSRWNIPNHPVVGVSWFEALAYCEWLNRQGETMLPEELKGSGRCIRLLTEDEWEYAARGRSNLKYAVAGELNPASANYEQTLLKRTTTAGVFPASAEFGLYDMTGNTWDWTDSRWGADVGECTFPYGATYIENKIEQNRLDKLEYRIIRGGSWSYTADDLRCAVRLWDLPPHRFNYLGFRVCAFSLGC